MKERLDQILEKWNLLKHPFYQAWSMGTLPVDALKMYAREYGAFISTLPEGWLALNDSETAQEEREHAALWGRFASALDTQIGSPQLAETRSLVNISRQLFAQASSALGAMYAFEAQQPATATSKLNGLKTHYQLPAGAEPYFEIHSGNWHESEKLLAALESLSAEEQDEALAACERMAESMWQALTGIHNKIGLN